MSDIANNSYRKKTLSWCMYDWANSAFATTIMAAILPVYYSKVATSGLPAGKATIYWSYTITIALLATAFLAPVMGAISDHSNKKKHFIKILVSIGVIATGMLYFVGTGDWLFASLFFIIANIGFALSEIFYNSLLKFVARPDDVDRVSTLGYALGYLGGGLLLAINVLMFKFIDSSSLAARMSFLSVSVWWAVFTIPLMLNVNEPTTNTNPANVNYFNAGFSRLADTFREIRHYRQLFIFLIAFWIYNDGIGTIIKLAAIYGSELGIDSMSLIGALLVTQFVGIPFSLAFGKLANYIGTKKCIYIGLCTYTVISIAAYYMTSATHFWILAILVGTVQGGTQALSRSLFSTMVPEKKSAEFFGFYGMSSKFAGIFGPLCFALVSQLTGSSRLSILSLITFFVLGTIVLSFVDEKKGAEYASS